MSTRNEVASVATCLTLALGMGGGVASAETGPGASAPSAGTATAPAPGPPPTSRADRRAINGHQFLPGVVEAPLAVSSFGLSERLSYGSATGQRYDLAGEPTGETRTYSFGGVVTDVGFQTVLGEAFVIRGDLTVSIFSGTDSVSALVVGTTLQPGLALGAAWSYPLSEQVRIGLSLDADRSPQLNLLIMAAILDAIQRGGVVDGEGAFQQNNVTSWAPACSAAWVPHRAVGLIGRLGYVHSAMETASSGTLVRQGITVGLAADLDLRAFWPTVSMGANLAYADSIPLGGSISGVRDLSLGLMYNGKPDLALGVVLGAQTLRIRPQYPDPLKSTSPYLNIVLRAYWP